MRHEKLGVVTLFARAQSGLPFTPVVQGDVNGDGRGFDRAFIPNPAREADPAVAASIRTLLDAGSPTCEALRRSVPRARRGPQRMPWAVDAVAQRAVAPTDARSLGRARHAVGVPAEHPRGGRSARARQQRCAAGDLAATPDPVLFVPRGFDASAQRFRYDVNPRFADTRPNRTLLREPFRIVIDFSLQLSTDYDAPAAPPRRRAGEDERGLAAAARPTRSRRSTCRTTRRACTRRLLAERDSLLLTQGAGRRAPARGLRVLRARAWSVRRARRVPRHAATARAGKAELDSANVDTEGLLADLLGAARDRRLDRHGDAEGAVSDSAQHARHNEEGSGEQPDAVRPPRDDGARADGRGAGRKRGTSAAARRPIASGRVLGGPPVGG